MHAAPGASLAGRLRHSLLAVCQRVTTAGHACDYMPHVHCMAQQRAACSLASQAVNTHVPASSLVSHPQTTTLASDAWRTPDLLLQGAVTRYVHL